MGRQRHRSSSSSGGESSYKSVRIKRGIKIRRQSNNNVVILKIGDPVVQFGIFIYFLYCLDSEVQQPSYRTVLLLLVGWQLMSAIANFFYRDTKALNTERLIYLAVNIGYMALFFFLEKHLPEKNFGINETDAPFIHRNQIILMGGALIIAFWYNILCYREVKGLLSNMTEER